MRNRNKRRRKKMYIVLSAASVVAVIAGIVLPGFILKGRFDAGYGNVAAAPSEYYSAAGFAMSRNASAQMNIYDRLRLLSGSWDSTYGDATVYEMNVQMHEAVEAARIVIDEMYEQGVYPCKLSSEYGRWYGWSASPYKAVDNIFNTYTAYYWKVVFQRYDSDEHHVVYVTEDGTVVAAEAYILTQDAFEGIADIHTVKSTDRRLKRAVFAKQETDGLNPREWIVPLDMDVSGMRWKDMVRITVDEERDYYVMQLEDDTRYVISIRA